MKIILGLKEQRMLGLLFVLGLASSSWASAAAYTWDVTSGNWSTAGNWTPSGPPGSTSSTTNTDAINFGGIPLTASLTVTLDQPNQNVGSISYNNAGNFGVTIGTNLGNSLLLSSGGSIVNSAPGHSALSGLTVAAPIILEPTSGTGNGAYTFTSSSGGTGPLIFTGPISGGTTSGAITLTLNGTNTSTGSGGSISGLISNGGSTVNLIKDGLGIWTLNNTVADTYTGSTTINQGGLILALNVMTTPTNEINSSSALILSGGTLTVNGKASSVSSQAFNGTTLNAGTASAIVLAPGTSTSTTLSLGSLTRNAGAGINITIPTNSFVTTTTADTNASILGGWAIVNGTDWAVSAGTGTVAGNITALGSYTNDTWASGNNTTVTTTGTIAASSTTNSLRFNSGAANTLTLSGTNVITSGGILSTAANGANLESITAGSLTSGTSAGELDFTALNSGGILISSAIVNNGSTAISVGYEGPTGAKIQISGASTYTGATYLSGGRLVINSNSALPANTTLAFNPNGTNGVNSLLELNGHNVSVGALSGVGNNSGSGAGSSTPGAAITNGSATNATLTVTGQTYVGGVLTNTNSTFNGIIADVFSASGPVTGVSGSGGNTQTLGLTFAPTSSSTTLTLGGVNAYSGVTAINGGILSVNTLTTEGSGTVGTTASALGQSNNVATNLFFNGGILQYTGATTTTDRNYTVAANGGGFDASGTGAETVTGNMNAIGTSATTTFVLTGTSTAQNTLSGSVSNSGSGALTAVSKTGAGTWVLSNANTYTGGTSVSNGALMATNTSGSATGSGSILVSSGGTIGGVGTFAVGTGNNFNISGTVLVGSGVSSDFSNPTTLTAPTGTFSSATLTLNLNTAASGGPLGQSNTLSVGNSAITFTSTILQLNLVGNAVISLNTPYLLISGTSPGQFSGLSTMSFMGQTEITGGVTYSFADPVAATTYSNSYLILVGGNQIELEVVPEPSTWLMMVGGLIGLVVYHRGQKKRSAV